MGDSAYSSTLAARAMDDAWDIAILNEMVPFHAGTLVDPPEYVGDIDLVITDEHYDMANRLTMATFDAYVSLPQYGNTETQVPDFPRIYHFDTDYTIQWYNP